MEINEVKKRDLEPTDSFIVNKELNSDVFDDKKKMKSDIRNKLIEISNDALEKLYGNFNVEDIYLVGSLASYNWSKYSDFDLHIQIKYSDINKDVDLVEEYLDLFKKKWNSEYNITIYGYDVEIFVEDYDNNRDHINGIYSILNDRWVVSPNIDLVKEVDTKLVELKAVMLMERIDEIEKLFDNDKYSIDDISKRVDIVWDKIKKTRKDGIASPEGEFSIGNLVFKYLRRNEYIGKLINFKRKVKEEKYSI